jgi:hypothetical protein
VKARWRIGKATQVACAVLALCLAGAQPSKAEIRRILLSVEGLDIPAGRAITAFRINTWGVELLAVCHVPRGWELREEKSVDPDGYLAGRADGHDEPLRQLAEMYLVDVYDYQALPRGNPKSDYHPASLAGWVEIGDWRPFAEGRGRRRTLKPGNFRLKDAQGCPAWPSARP